MTRTQDLKVVLPKYSLPEIKPQVKLPGEVNTTFADEVHQIITQNDDHLAAFKYSRFNNFKPGRFSTLCHYDNESELSHVLEVN
jgi:hypothetical protein